MCDSFKIRLLTNSIIELINTRIGALKAIITEDKEYFPPDKWLEHAERLERDIRELTEDL